MLEFNSDDEEDATEDAGDEEDEISVAECDESWNKLPHEHEDVVLDVRSCSVSLAGSGVRSQCLRMKIGKSENAE